MNTVSDSGPLIYLAVVGHFDLLRFYFPPLGILIDGKRDRRIPNIKAVLDQLIKAGFYLNPNGPLYLEVLQRAGEA